MRSKKKFPWKKIMLAFGAIVLLGVAFMGWQVYKFYKSIYVSKEPTVNLASKPVEEKKVFNILLVGYGGKNHDGAYLTDTMMVAHLDLKQKKVLLVSLPRDIWVEVPTRTNEGFHAKINSVYQMGLFQKKYPAIDTKYSGELGAASLLKETVEKVTGLPIDNYVAIDFDGFKRAVDLLGGVDVDVETTFDDYEYPVDGKETDTCGKTPEEFIELEKIATQSPTLAFPCRYEHLHFDAGLTHMDGATALKYVRSRHSLQDGTDFGRAARQQRFLQASRDKVLNIGFISKIIPLMSEMKDYIRMDFSLEDMQKFLAEADKSRDYKISNLVISNDDVLKNSYSPYGGFILVPRAGVDNWQGVHDLVDMNIRGVTPTPSKIATASAALK